MKKAICLLTVIGCSFFLISDSSFVHRRVREEFNYWRDLQTEVEKIDFGTVKEGLNGKEQFRALLDEITTRGVYKLVDLIQKGEERYYQVVDYVSYSLIPYLKQYYEQLISDDAVGRRAIILICLFIFSNISTTAIDWV
jgi:hypothetical protein